MAQTADSNTGKPSVGEPLPVGAPVRVSRLDDLKHVRAELARVYREARRREGRYPDALTAMRLANVLAGVRNAIEVDELRARIEQLEHEQQRKDGGNGSR